jgi:hypothetical protein
MSYEIKSIGELIEWVTAYQCYKEAKESGKKHILVSDIDSKVAEFFLLPIQDFISNLGSIVIK